MGQGAELSGSCQEATNKFELRDWAFAVTCLDAPSHPTSSVHFAIVILESHALTIFRVAPARYAYCPTLLGDGRAGVNLLVTRRGLQFIATT